MKTSTVEALMAMMGSGAAGAASNSKNGTARGDKVSVVGSGQLALATLFALMSQRVSKELVIIDKDLSDIKKEISDIEDAALYMGYPRIRSTLDWEQCRDSRVVIFAYGDTGDMDLNRSVRLLRTSVMSVVQSCPGAVLLVATRPSDVLSWCVWRIASPHVPPHRILGVGCTLETARFRRAVAQRLQVAPSAVQALVLGRTTPAWTMLTACGVRLRDVNPRIGAVDDPEDWPGTLQDVANIPGMKAIAAAAAHIADAIIRDTRDCLPVATHVSGCRNPVDPTKDIFMSMPCVLGHRGVAYIVRQALSPDEKTQLQNAADRLSDIQSTLEVS